MTLFDCVYHCVLSSKSDVIMDFRCEGGNFPVSSSSVTISNPHSLSSSETGINHEKKEILKKMTKVLTWMSSILESHRCYLFYSEEKSYDCTTWFRIWQFQTPAQIGVFKWISWLNGLLFGIDDRGLLKEVVKSFLMAPTSPFNSPNYFPVFASIVYGCNAFKSSCSFPNRVVLVNAGTWLPVQEQFSLPRRERLTYLCPRLSLPDGLMIPASPSHRGKGLTYFKSSTPRVHLFWDTRMRSFWSSSTTYSTKDPRVSSCLINRSRLCISRTFLRLVALQIHFVWLFIFVLNFVERMIMDCCRHEDGRSM